MSLDRADYRLIKDIHGSIETSRYKQEEFFREFMSLSRDMLATQKELVHAFREVADTLREIRDERRPHKTGRPLIKLAPGNENKAG